MRHLILGLIKLYQLLFSPLIGGRCRFQPTCSHYCYQAVEKYGVLRGGLLALKRIAKCHPWGDSGYDPLA